jgi:hypothetical protein
VSSQWSRARESTRDWIGVGTPTSHGSLPTQSAETRSVARGLAVVSVSQGTESYCRLASAALPSEEHKIIDISRKSSNFNNSVVANIETGVRVVEGEECLD